MLLWIQGNIRRQRKASIGGDGGLAMVRQSPSGPWVKTACFEVLAICRPPDLGSGQAERRGEEGGVDEAEEARSTSAT